MSKSSKPKIIKISALILLLLTVFTLFVYDIKFNSDGYDILLRNRFTKLGFGIEYKDGFEIWQFAHTVHGGIAEKPLYPSVKRISADIKNYKVDLDKDGKNEIITLKDNFDTQAEGLVAVFTSANKEIGHISMPDHLDKVEFISLNNDGLKQIVAWSYGGAHYTNIAIYGYKDGTLYKIFENGSACGIDTNFKENKPLIKVGRANWEEKGWCYADEPLWETYTWDGENFVYDMKLSTTRRITEIEEANRFLEEAKK